MSPTEKNHANPIDSHEVGEAVKNILGDEQAGERAVMEKSRLREARADRDTKQAEADSAYYKYRKRWAPISFGIGLFAAVASVGMILGFFALVFNGVVMGDPVSMAIVEGAITKPSLLIGAFSILVVLSLGNPISAVIREWLIQR